MTSPAKAATNPGVGMPAGLYLDEFGSKIYDAFGKPAYHVGSSLAGKTWRDVDVRLILDDAEFEAMELGNPAESRNAKLIALTMAWSALGEKMTGLPIDFQIQQQTHANEKYDGPRSALGLLPYRYAK